MKIHSKSLFFSISGENERDLVLLQHSIGFEDCNGRKATEEINLTVYGEPYGGLTAMAKCVGYPAAVASKMILEGQWWGGFDMLNITLYGEPYGILDGQWWGDFDIEILIVS